MGRGYGHPFKIKKEVMATHLRLRKRLWLPVQDFPVEKKSKTFSTTRGGSPTAKKLKIDLTSSKLKKEAAESELVKPATSEVARTIVDKIAQRKGSVLPRYLGLH